MEIPDILEPYLVQALLACALIADGQDDRANQKIRLAADALGDAISTRLDQVQPGRVVIESR
jgi:hypothetical protein